MEMGVREKGGWSGPLPQQGILQLLRMPLLQTLTFWPLIPPPILPTGYAE